MEKFNIRKSAALLMTIALIVGMCPISVCADEPVATGSQVTKASDSQATSSQEGEEPEPLMTLGAKPGVSTPSTPSEYVFSEENNNLDWSDFITKDKIRVEDDVIIRNATNSNAPYGIEVRQFLEVDGGSIVGDTPTATNSVYAYIDINPYDGDGVDTIGIDFYSESGEYLCDGDRNARFTEHIDFVWKSIPNGNGSGWVVCTGTSEADEVNRRFKELVKAEEYAFGDWNLNNSINTDDIKAGIADQVYYSILNNGRYKQDFDNYGITSASDLRSHIAVDASPTETLKVTNASGSQVELAGYMFRINLQGTDEQYTVGVETAAYLINDGDWGANAAENSRQTLIARVGATGEDNNIAYTYFLRTKNVDEAKPSAGGEDDDKALTIVHEYDACYDEDSDEYQREIYAFGNGLSLDTLLSADEDMSVAVKQARNEDLLRDIAEDAGLNEEDKAAFMNKFIVMTKVAFYQSDVKGVYVKASGSLGNTPEWGYAKYPVCSTGFNESSSITLEKYIGNDNITIRPLDVNSEISGIEKIEKVDESISDEAISIATGSDGSYIVRFYSNYYDEVVLKITYTLTSGGTQEGYFTIHRVGLAIHGDWTSGDATASQTLLHGTENGPTYTYANGKPDVLVYASYYYNDDSIADTDDTNADRADLFVTYTWKDGSITRELIKNRQILNLAYNDEKKNLPTSDYILYEGDFDEAPAKIDAIAVKRGTVELNDADTFSGAEIGSGKGVEWEISISR